MHCCCDNNVLIRGWLSSLGFSSVSTQYIGDYISLDVLSLLFEGTDVECGGGMQQQAREHKLKFPFSLYAPATYRCFFANVLKIRKTGIEK